MEKLVWVEDAAVSMPMTLPLVLASGPPESPATIGAFTSISSLNTSLATATNITAGAQITPAMFSDSKDTAIVNQIHGTMRAVQLAFNANRVLGGTLKAGDHVDIFGEMTIQSSRNNSTYSQQTVAARIITNVEVLSTYDTGVATTPLTSASGANSASGTDGTPP